MCNKCTFYDAQEYFAIKTQTQTQTQIMRPLSLEMHGFICISNIYDNCKVALPL